MMRYEVFDINIDYQTINVDNGGFQPKMSVYLPDNSPEIQIDRKHPTVVICPGGGYAMTSDREAEPIALRFAAAGCNAVVVRYSCVPARFPAALFELSYAVAKVRENAQEWNVDTDRIAVCGFSAGGHLAASFSTLWNRDFVKEYFDYQGGENKPNGMILGYPVITSGEHAHGGSIENLLGEKTADPILLELTLRLRSSGTPLMMLVFLWKIHWYWHKLWQRKKFRRSYIFIQKDLTDWLWQVGRPEILLLFLSVRIGLIWQYVG